MRRLTSNQKEEMVKMYESGKYTFKDLDIYFGAGLGTCRGFLLRRGYKAKSHSEINRKYPLNEDFFDSINSEEKAYFLGLLYADGCNTPKVGKIMIGLSEKDKEILVTFQSSLGYNRPLYYKTAKGYENSKPQYVLTISSKKMSLKLEELGMVRAKSLVLKFPSWMNHECINSFVRGYFDGDGSISGNKEQKWSIIGTEDFLRGVQNIMVSTLKIGIPELRKRNNVFYLEYRGRKQIEKIKQWLYQDATIFLKRKYEKYL